MSHKYREGKHQHLAYHGLIKLIVEDALNNLTILVPWSNFIGMDIETLLGTWSITPGETPVSILSGKDIGIEEEETERKT